MASTANLDGNAVEELQEQFRGTLLRPGEAGYDEARTIWNAMIDREPAVIAQCEGTADVISAMNFAREHDLLVSVKGGGHNVAGDAVCDDGIVIDCSPMNSVRVDPDSETARVGPGATLAEFDHEAQTFGLATPVGYNSTTGIAGLTLGGGFGWLSRKYSLTADNLLSADVVTAEGDLVRASKDENEDLFWGLRGGGGNFGIVTSFEFQLHDVGPEVLSGLLIYPFEDTSEILREYRAFVSNVSDDVTVWAVLRHAPPLPFIPEEWHGEKVLILAAFYAEDMDDGKEALQPLREIGDPIVDVISPHQYAGWQQAFDGLLEPGARNYWKSHNFLEITDGMIQNFVEYMERMPTGLSEIAIAQLGGAINEVPTDATAYPHREAEFLMNLHTRWENPELDEECIAWARDLYDEMIPYATGGSYVNFITEEEGEEHLAYRENQHRLVRLKNEWDPENLFRMNQNIEPTV